MKITSTACPVGALDLGFQEEVAVTNHITLGFVNVGIKPAIQIIPLRKEHEKPKIVNSDAPKIDASCLESYALKPTSKINLKTEWTLVLFTLSVASLVAWMASSVTHNVFNNPILFITISVFAIILTSFHVGKKIRMWRFVLNVKNSWLSREIIGFSVFFYFRSVDAFLKYKTLIISELLPFINSEFLVHITIVFGVFTLISIDIIYSILIRKDNFKLHSAMVCFTGLLLFAWFTNNIFLIASITLLKSVMYVIRKLTLSKQKINFFPKTSIWILISTIFIGEMIDRIEFYYESEVTSPRLKLANLFEESIDENQLN